MKRSYMKKVFFGIMICAVNACLFASQEVVVPVKTLQESIATIAKAMQESQNKDKDVTCGDLNNQPVRKFRPSMGGYCHDINCKKSFCYIPH